MPVFGKRKKMNKKLLLIALTVLIITGINGCKKSNTDIVYKRKYISEIKNARKHVSSYMVQNFIPGANVAVSINGEMVYSEGFGWVSKDLDVRAKRSNKFRIGELSALFTNALYLKLVDDGKINPDSAIQYYYHSFPVKKEGKITSKMLANNISGIRPPQGDEEMKLVNTSIEKGLDLFKNDPLDMSPGEFQIASCYNHNLLGVVLEKATGEKFSNLLKSYLTDTLHMDNTVIDNPFTTIKGRSDFYELNILSQIINSGFYDLRVNAPSKGLLSNAEDLVKLGNAFLEGDYFTEETRTSLFEPLHLYKNNTSRMVNGWLVFKDNFGRTVYGLEGSVAGGSAALVIYPEQKLVIGYACNLSSVLHETPVFLVANKFLSTSDTREQTPSKLK